MYASYRLYWLHVVKLVRVRLPEPSGRLPTALAYAECSEFRAQRCLYGLGAFALLTSAAKKGWHLPAAVGGLTPLLPWHLGQPPGTTTDQQPTELPLYYDAGDRTRFAYAIFLLNKDIEQLLHAHGLASSGPNQLLQNLYKLTSAAAAALPASQAQHAVVGGGLMHGSMPAGEGGSAVGRLLGPDDWHAAGHEDAGSSSLPSLLQQGWLGSFPARK